MKMLVAAIAALTMGLSTSAAAATLVDYETGGVDSHGIFSAEYGNQIVERADGLGHAIFAQLQLVGERTRAVLTRGATEVVLINDRPYFRNVSISSIDVFAVNETAHFGPNVPAGEWTTLTFGPNDQPMAFMVDSDFYIDNVVYEVEFVRQPGGVPEPATWAVMIMGFGLAGSELRRRRLLVA